MTYNILVVKPVGYLHSGAFFEVAEWLQSALRSLGQDARIGTEPAGNARNIIFGSHLLGPDIELPEGSILFNLELMHESSLYLSAAQLARLRTFEVWDCSGFNAAAYVRFGLPEPKIVPIGAAGELVRIFPRLDDIDVLFYGSWTDRRGEILNRLKVAGLNVVHLWGIYGGKRDEEIARAKVVLNVHFHPPRLYHQPAQIFEMVRVSYLLNNRRCVVSERSADDSVEREFEGGIAFASYDELVDTCVRLCAEPLEREAIGNRGFEILCRRDLSGLARAIGIDLDAHLAAQAIVKSERIRHQHAPGPRPRARFAHISQDGPTGIARTAVESAVSLTEESPTDALASRTD